MPVSFRLAAAIPAAIRSSSCPALRPNSRSLAPGGTGASAWVWLGVSVLVLAAGLVLAVKKKF